MASAQACTALIERLAELRHRADQALSQRDARAPAQRLQPAHIQLFPGRAIRFARIPARCQLRRRPPT
jgi:hypothetical protein